MYKKKLLTTLICFAAAVVTLLSQESVAYYSVFGEATNVVTSGEISIRISEKMGEKEFPTDGVYVMPGRIVGKKVSVQNNGENPCWVRIKLSNDVDKKELSADILELDINKTDWIFDEGFYYYKKILEPNTETEPLFSQVKVAGSTDNSYLGANVKLRVTAFAVQSEYNDSSSSPLDVNGWPAES